MGGAVGSALQHKTGDPGSNPGPDDDFFLSINNTACFIEENGYKDIQETIYTIHIDISII